MTAQWKSDLYIMSMVTDWIGWHSHYQLIIKIAISAKLRLAKLLEKGKIHTKIVIGLFNLKLWMWLVYLK